MKKKYTTQGVAISLIKAVLYFALWILAQFVVVNFAALVISRKFPVSSSSELTEMVEGMSLEINILVGALVVIVLAVFSMLRKTTLSKDACINKYPPQFTITTIIMGVAVAYAIMLAFSLIQKTGILPDSWFQAQESAYSDVYSASPFMQFISVGFVAPVMEEILFRGFMLGALKKEMHPWAAIVVSALFFSVAHGTPIGMIYTFFLGIIMAWLTIKFKSIVPSLLFHMAYNCAVAYSDGVSMGVAILSLPILFFEFMSINNYFRGKKE